MPEKKACLIVGGTSGLGLELARLLNDEYEVIVTGSGRHNPAGFDVRECDLSAGPDLASNIGNLIVALPHIDLMIYAAGFAQLGTVTDLEDEEIGKMACVGIIAPVLFTRELLKKQGVIKKLVAITSTSAWTPRRNEPMYTAVKAGLGMLAHSLSLDERIGSVLVAAPGGMRTPFWEHTGTDTVNYMDPPAVAEIIVSQFAVNYQYRCIKIPRDTGKLEIIEEDK